MISLAWASARCLLACATLALAGAAPPPPGGTLRIVVTNVRAAKGKVHVDICTQAQFLGDCPIAGEARAVVGTTVVTIQNLAPGTYGAQVFYDENSNGRVDRALFGIPKEGVGFSRDAPISFSPPKWKDAKFDYDGGDRTITLKLRYFLGGDAPRR